MSSKPNKTKATTADVAAFIDGQPKEEVRDDCRTLMKLMHDLTGAEPYMYGPTIIGYGNYHYRYASGHEGDAPLAGFNPRKPALVVYLSAEVMEPALLADLGKHKATKGCLYVKRLADIDMHILKSMIKKSIALTKKMYP